MQNIIYYCKQMTTTTQTQNDDTIQMDFPTLTKDNQYWKIALEQNAENPQHYDIITKYGKIGGKEIVARKTIREGKAGKTIHQQALQEVNRKWKDKKNKELYEIQKSQQSQSQECSNNDRDIILQPSSAIQVRPMLANKVNRQKIKYPCFVQPKLDGIRCLISFVIGGDNDSKKIYCESRTGQEIEVMTDHYNNTPQYLQQLLLIEENIKKQLGKPNSKIILDGELYCHSLSFEEINGVLRKKRYVETLQSQTDENQSKTKKPKVSAEKQKKLMEEWDKIETILAKIQFHWYDLIIIDCDQSLPLFFEKRTQCIETSFDAVFPQLFCDNYIEKVDTFLIHNDAEFKEAFDEFIKQEYEGIMLRDANGIYEINKRSKYLQKYKEFLDDEFEIVGFESGTGRDENCVIWVCKTKEGKTFSVRPKQTIEKRKEEFLNASTKIGKKMTVIYQELTEDGIPRFGVGKGIRCDV